MQIILAENDAYLHEDGRPRIFIFRVDGRPFPCPEGTTIGELWGAVQRMSGLPPTSPPVPVVGGFKDALAELVGPPKIVASDPQRIERNDIVKLSEDLKDDIGTPSGLAGGSEEGPQKGVEYRVIEIKAVNGQHVAYDVVDDNAPVRFRMTIPAHICVLVRKSPPRAPRKPNELQMLHKCQECQDTFVLTLGKDGLYGGACENTKCLQVGKEVKVQRELTANNALAS